MGKTPLEYTTGKYRMILNEFGYDFVYVSNEGFDDGVVCIIFDSANIEWNDYNERKDKRKILVLKEEEFILNYRQILESV